MAPLMWRLDHCWRKLPEEIPTLRHPPSTYVRRHFWFTTQPMEEPPQPRYFRQLLEHMDADDRMMFATDYPHWDFDSPENAVPAGLSLELRKKIMSENARSLYGLD